MFKPIVDAAREAETPPLESADDGFRLNRCVVFAVMGIFSAQSWMPMVRIFSCAYREGGVSLGSLAPLILPYVLVFACACIALALPCARSVPESGICRAFAGASSVLVGGVLLFVVPDIVTEKARMVLVVAGSALGLGGAVLVMTWCRFFDQIGLEKAVKKRAVAVILPVCCILSAASQAAGAPDPILALTCVLAFVSAGLYALSIRRCHSFAREFDVCRLHSFGARMGLSFGLLGLAFTLMVMQFCFAPHALASPWTWAFGFAGILAAFVMLLVGKIVRKRWDALLGFRLLSIFVIVAFFPVDPGSEFSLRFALCFSMVALWAFASISLPAIVELANILRMPFSLLAGAAGGGLYFGIAVGYLGAWGIQGIGLGKYAIYATAIASILAAVFATNFLVTRDTAIRASRSMEIALSEDGRDAASEANVIDLIIKKQAVQVAKAYGLTEREAEVLGILACGYGTSRVQEALFVSEGTAITHRRHIYRKLGVHSKQELIDKVKAFSEDR